MIKKIIFILTPFILYAKPVKVDEILTDTNKFKIETAISYANINKKENVIAPISYQTTSGAFVTIPSYLGVQSTNQDYVNLGISFKYGLSEKIEVFSGINMFYQNTNISDSSFSSISDKGFNNLNFGLIYELKKEDETPSFLVGGSIDLLEKTSFSNGKEDNQSFKSYSFFATSYYTVDPLVFLLKADYRLNLEKEYENKSIDAGEIFILSPNIYFAINPYTSLNWGVKYQYKTKDKVDNIVSSNNSSSVGYAFGVSYELNSKTIVNFDTEKLDTNEYDSNNITLSMTYKF